MTGSAQETAQKHNQGPGVMEQAKGKAAEMQHRAGGRRRRRVQPGSTQDPHAPAKPACLPPPPSVVLNFAGENLDQIKHSTQEAAREAKNRADEATRPGADATR